MIAATACSFAAVALGALAGIAATARTHSPAASRALVGAACFLPVAAVVALLITAS